MLGSSVRIRLLSGDEIAFGPGKAELLLAIQTEGSIAAAAKQLAMSYRRAWRLVETMNRCAASPLVAAAKGGSGGGGAAVTAVGLAMLAEYQRLEAEVRQLVESRIGAFEEVLGMRELPRRRR
jgi:molybdate transport system regulatory protein